MYTTNNKARGTNHSYDLQWVSHGIICPNYLTQSCFQTEQNNSDQDDKKIVVSEFPAIVSSNDRLLLDGRQFMDLQNNTKSLFRMDGRQFMDLPIRSCRIRFWNRSWILFNSDFLEKGGESLLSSIIPTILRQERSPNTCLQAWPSPRSCTIETTSLIAVKLLWTTSALSADAWMQK